MLLFILLLAFLTIFIPAGILSSVYSRAIIIIFVIGLLALGFVIFFLWWQRKKRLERMRALEISDVDKMTGQDFEKYVSEILKTQGHTIALTKITGDYGGDIVGHKNGITTVFQLKRYTNSVGEEAIQQAVAAKAYYKASIAFVVTNNYFTPFARELAKVNSCYLIDREKLGSWIADFQRKSHIQEDLLIEENEEKSSFSDLDK